MALIHPHRPTQARPSSMPITTGPCQGLVAPTTPSIAISHDGEEGYTPRIYSSMIKNTRLEDVIRPPPNRTVYEGESPPPYRSKSFGGGPERPHHGAGGRHQHPSDISSITSVRSYSMSSPTRRSPHRTSSGSHMATIGGAGTTAMSPGLSSSYSGLHHMDGASPVLPPSYGQCLQAAMAPRPRSAADITDSRTQSACERNTDTFLGEVTPPPEYHSVVTNNTRRGRTSPPTNQQSGHHHQQPGHQPGQHQGHHNHCLNTRNGNTRNGRQS